MDLCKCFSLIVVMGGLFPFSISADDLFLFHSARSLAMGEATVARCDGWDSPASLAATHRVACIIDYRNHYLLRQLSTYRVGLAYRFDWMESRIQLSRFGYETYNETLLSLNFSKKLSEYWLVGIRLNGLLIQYPDHRGIWYLSPEVALAYSRAKWGTALHVANLRYTVWSRGNGMLALHPIYRLGALIRPLSGTILIGELFKSVGEPLNCRLGVEYFPIECLAMRLGVRTASFVPSIGIGWRWAKICVDAAFSWHMVLGVSSSLQLSFGL